MAKKEYAEAPVGVGKRDREGKEANAEGQLELDPSREPRRQYRPHLTFAPSKGKKAESFTAQLSFPVG